MATVHPGNLLDFYREHRLEVEAFQDEMTLFTLRFLSLLGSATHDELAQSISLPDLGERLAYLTNSGLVESVAGQFRVTSRGRQFLSETGSEGPGASYVGPIGIVLITVYLILFSIFLLYGLVQFWPVPTPVGEAIPTTTSVTIFIWTFSISDEVRLLVIVALASALGSMVHALRSLYWYVGNRRLMQSWSVMYIPRPFIGAALGLVFYFVVRGGFFSPQAAVQQTNPFGFAALAALVGVFLEQVTLKLKEVAETLLAPTPKGEDYVAPKTEEESGVEAKPQGEG